MLLPDDPPGVPMRATLFLAGVLAAGSMTWFGIRRHGAEIEAGPSEAPAILLSDEEQEAFAMCEALYHDATLEQVTQELALPRAELDAGTLGYYEQEFARGAHVLDGRYTPGESYPMKNPGPELCARRFLPSGEVIKVVLPREGFPEMYDLRDRIAWLAHRQEELNDWGK